MKESRRLRLEQVYASHPIAAAAVLDRVLQHRHSLQGLREADLAEAPAGWVTDQNHAGGALMTRSLAKALALKPGDLVLDVGAGIGGAVRLFAEECGCRCHGIELTSARFRDAVELTGLVGLSDRVTFTHGDFLETAASQPYDVVVAQGVTMHFTDFAGFVHRVSTHLRAGGRLAIEDAVLTDSSAQAADEHAELIAELEVYWNGQFQTLGTWTRALTDCGFHVDAVTDFSTIAIDDFRQALHHISQHPSPSITSEEMAGSVLGLRLFESGTLQHVRLIATKETRLARGC